MIIKDIDALQNWLTQTLSPVCDADPQALAKYVVALVKKDKTEEELKTVCFDQLDVFLQEKTKEFVDKLFVALGDDSYITPETRPVKPVVVAPPPPPAAIPAQLPPGNDAENKEERVPDAQQRMVRANDDVPIRRKSRSRSPGQRRSPPNRDAPRDLRRFINQRRQGPPPSRYGRPRRRSRSRTPSHGKRRSRSPGRPRSRTPDRSRSRSPAARKRSPRPRSQGVSPRPRTRSRSPRLRSRSPRRSRSPARRRSRPRSPVYMRPRSPGARYRRSPGPRSRSPGPRSRSRERYRSRTPPPPHRRSSKSWSRSLSPFSDSVSGGSRSRSRSRHRSKTKSPVRRDRPSSDSRGSTPLNDSPRYDRVIAPGGPFKPRIRCRDFDVQGFCMQGDLCPYDHGIDPVVVDDVNLSTVLPFTSQVPPPGVGIGGGPSHPPRAPGPPPHMEQVPPGLPAPGPRHPPPPGAPPHAPVHQRLGPMPNRGNMGPHSPPPPPGTVPVQQPPVSTGANFPPRPDTSQPPPPPPPIHMGMNDNGPRPPPFMPGPNRPPGPWNQSQRPPVGHGPSGPGWQGPPRGPPPPLPHRHPHPPDNKMPPQSAHMEIQVEDKGASRTVIAAGSGIGMKRPFSDSGHGGGFGGRGGPPAKRGMGRGRRPFNPSYAENASLELRKIPPNLNNIMSINNHFSKFGNLTNVQVCYKGESDAALITFANHAQATAALKSPEPVLNNRFVKVFWHRKDEDADNQTGDNSQPASTTSQGVPVAVVAGDDNAARNTSTTSTRPSVKERLGIPPAHKLSLNNTKPAVSKEDSNSSAAVVVSPTGNLTKTVFNPTASSTRPESMTTTTTPTTAVVAPKPRLDSYQARCKEMQARQALKKSVELHRQKQILLQKQFEQQKKLLLKLESNKNMPAKERDVIIKTIKVLANSIDKLKKEITEFSESAKKQAAAAAATPVPAAPKPAQDATTAAAATDPQEGFQNILNETKKAILDTELDLISKKTSGADTSELRKKVAELKREAHSLGLLGAGRGRGAPTRGGRGRGRGLQLGDFSHSLDKRPKELLVSGFDLAEKEEVVAHMSTFGEVANIVHDDSAPSVIITYISRPQAERAVREGYTFKSKHLMMAWHKPNKPRTPTTPKHPGSTASTGSATGGGGSGSGTPKGAGSLVGSPLVVGETEDVNDGLPDNSNDEEERDDDPLEGEDLVGGPGSYVIDEDDELDEVDEDVLLGLDDDEEEEEAHTWKR